ncbi:hypothetical protein GCK72_018078 [Caenorhabditis remanei]|uniref:Uncharacterized protein n=1 Tax=Caenorhabditis remanei TaxID=31234 RepID=A0A6A5GA42_CAERE|nr:hypothetical protein GCK72_018078 [Caenorhabditis remanei]KAF1751524.1 hypothetical protein GCK72_018078 [Caenorhabditis remanei]
MALKKIEESKSAPFIFYKDRLGTFKNYIYDDYSNATCTSKTLARAGFVWTGDESAMCPFCLKDLSFDPDDDPWEEHKKRGSECEFVQLGKLDDLKLTLADCISLAQSAIIMAQYKKHENSLKLLEQRTSSAALSGTVTEAMKPAKPSTTKSRRVKRSS